MLDLEPILNSYSISVSKIKGKIFLACEIIIFLKMQPKLFQSRGSENPNTGPIRDHSSFASNRVTGAFAFIDASSPRRPHDRAHLVSRYDFT